MRKKKLLPEVSTEKEYAKLYADISVWLPAMQVICERHGLDAQALRQEQLGTHVVFRTGARILKLFSPLWGGQFHAERAALEHVRGLPIPEIIAEGALEGWPYLVMSLVPGKPALEVWGGLGEAEKGRLLGDLGRMMRALHEHAPLEAVAMDWAAFLRKRIDRAEEHHAVGEPWRRWVRERLAGFREAPFDPVLLHADITEDHVLLDERRGRWEIVGLIDFGDARMGHPYYEFLAPLAFLCFGHPERSRALVEGYGLALTEALAEELTTYCLLHEFGRLRDFTGRHPVANGEEFFRALWGTQ